jgi:hypothetical protein
MASNRTNAIAVTFNVIRQRTGGTSFRCSRWTGVSTAFNCNDFLLTSLR